ncbi:hypothetical protein ACFLVW_03365 [Chloroflexota bacterium]
MPDTQIVFDVYIAIDFSGSKHLSSQKQHIAFAEMELLSQFFRPTLSETERLQAEFEGWILGVK